MTTSTIINDALATLAKNITKSTEIHAPINLNVKNPQFNEKELSLTLDKFAYQTLQPTIDRLRDPKYKKIIKRNALYGKTKSVRRFYRAILATHG